MPIEKIGGIQEIGGIQLTEEQKRTRRERTLTEIRAEQGRLQQEFLVQSTNPKSLIDFYKLDPNALPDHDLDTAAGRLAKKAEDSGYGPIVEFEAGAVDSRGNRAMGRFVHSRSELEFVQEFEEAWASYGDQGIPDTWWMDQAPEDIRLLAARDPIFGDIAAEIEAAQQGYAEALAYTQAEEKLVQERLESQRSRFGNVWEFGIQTVLGNEPQSEEEIREEVHLQFSAEARRQAAEQGNTGWRSWTSGLWNLASKNPTELGLWAVSGGKDIEVSNPSPVMDLGRWVNSSVGTALAVQASIDRNRGSLALTDNFYDWLTEDQREENAAALARVEASYETSDDDLIDTILTENALQQFMDMEQTEPEVFNDFVNRAGGDVVKGMGFWVGGVRENLEARKAMEDYVENLRQEERELITELSEFDFSPGKAFLKLAESYSRGVPMMTATAVTLMLSESDMIGGGWSDTFARFAREIEEHDRSPAKVLGMEGSLTGMLLDLGAGIAFDPLTWLFGPRGSVRTVKPGAAAAAHNMAHSPYVDQRIDDVFRILTADDAGATQAALAMADFDDIARAEIYALGGYTNKQLPFTHWKDAPLGKFGENVEVATLNKIGHRGQEIGPIRADPKLVESYRTHGVLDPIEVTVSRVDRGVHISDGARRLAAANEAGIRRIPTRLRIVDDAHQGNVMIPGLTDKTMAKVKSVAAEAPIEGLTDEVLDQRMINQLVRDPTNNIEHVRSRPIVGEIEHQGSFLDVHLESTSGRTGQGSVLNYYVVNRNTDQVVAGVKINTMGERATMSTASRTQGEGMMTKVWDWLATQQDIPHPITMHGASESTSISARNFGIKYARRMLDEQTVPMMENTGTLIDDLLEEGQQLVGDMIYGPGVNHVRPSKLLPQEAILGPIPREAMRDSIRRGIIERGMVLDGASRTAVHMAWNAGARAAMRESGAVQALERYTSGHATTTTWATVGTNAVDDTTELIFRMFGDDLELADEFVQRLLDGQLADGAAELRQLARQDEVLRLQTEIDDITAAGGDGWNSWDEVGESLKRKKERTATQLESLPDDADALTFAPADEFDDLALKQEPITLEPDAQLVDEAEIAASERGMNMEDGYDELLEDLHSGEVDAQTIIDGGSVDEARAVAAKNTGKTFDEYKALADDAAEQYKVHRANRRQLQKLITERTKELNKVQHAIDKQAGKVRKMNEIIRDVIHDAAIAYNKKYIATNPVWKKFVDEDGLVPWDVLRKGRGDSDEAAALFREGDRHVLTKNAKQAAEEQGLTLHQAEELLAKLNITADTVVSTQLPLSPLEMLMARELGAAQYTRAVSSAGLAQIRDGLYQAQKLWIMDKVFRPSTAAVVSFDELLRIWHIGGFEQGMARWFRDRGLFTAARAKAALHGRNPIRNGVRQGAEYMSPAAQERIRLVGMADNWSPQAERQLLDNAGLGYVDIHPGQRGYDDAIKRWSGGLLQDSSFRAMLRGEDEFLRFYQTDTGAQHLREGMALKVDKSGAVVSTQVAAKEYYDGWITIMDIMLADAKKAGKFDEVMDAFRATAAKIDEVGGLGKLENLPDWTFNYTGSVRGVRKLTPNRQIASKISETFFENFFMSPVNYRRGFLAEMTRQTERARIQSLLASAGKEIISDAQAEALFGVKGMAGAGRYGLRQVVQEQALKNNKFLQSYVDDLVEKAVRREMDNTLYTFDKGSRMGAQSKVVFPFGKPWADMAGFWGREVLRKPVARGWMNRKGFGLLKSAVESMPVNPRPLALMSRLAGTDFTVDRGLIGTPEFRGKKFDSGPDFLHSGGIIPGSDESDFSPLFFLPTGGENPFGVLLPGLGFVPIWFLDRYIGAIDPVDNPTEYQARLNSISQFVPAAAFQQGGTLSRILGGGIGATGLSLITDVIGGVAGVPQYQLTSLTGDITREVNRTREMSALMANPEVWEEAFSLQTAEEVEAWLEGLALSADRNASKTHGVETLVRFVIPVDTKDHSALGEILDVWVDASEMFDELGVRQSLAELDLSKPENREAYADSVRRSFFKLDQRTRDGLVAEFPQLAVNLVSSWEWTQRAINEGMATESYRTDGTRVGLARHQNLVTGNYIRPIQPVERAKRVFGLIDAAQRNTAKAVFETVALDINEVRWNSGQVTDSTKQLMDLIASSDFGTRWNIQDGRDMWTKWDALREEFWMWMADEQGIEQVRGVSGRKEDLTPYDKLRKNFTFPGKEQSWGTTWPGLDKPTDTFAGLTFHGFPQETIDLAKRLGLELEPGMTGQDFYNVVQDYLVNNDTAIAAVGEAAYNIYNTERNATRQAVTNDFHHLMKNTSYDEEYRQGIKEFIAWEQANKDFYFGTVDGIPLNIQQQTVDRFQKIRMASADVPDTVLDWDHLWEQVFERSYGPLEWKVPEPPRPILANGQVNSNAIQPFIVNVPDGDTLVYKVGETDSELHQVRLLGVRAADFGRDVSDAVDDTNRLLDVLQEAVENDDTIWLVRDPEQFGNVDRYGRLLAFLWIGDTPYYFPDNFRRHQDPSEDDR
jgi:hypothetical protein